MYKTLIIVAALFFSFANNAQTFTWKRGSNAGGPIGSYGAMGVPSVSNDPGGRHGSATWTDASGNLWLFGGEGYAGNTTLGWLNDLWKYDVITNQWTWIRGSNNLNAVGVYGTQGVASSANDPGAREFSMTWTDNAGNLWLFGGDGFATTSTFGRLSDLWKYDPVNNQWTWIKGVNNLNQFGIYGTQGVANPANFPGARFGAAVWKEGNEFWMFGGRGYASGGPANFLNDLWKYDPANNEWTWMKGSNLSGQSGTFGTINVPASSNNPGGKEFPAAWKDNEGKLYLFGGRGAGYFNDLWKFEPANNNWTWINGSSTANQTGSYGTMNVPSPNNHPGGRYASASWTDASGNFLLFGGTGWSATNLNFLNDLFKYNPCTNEWTWLKGSDTTNQPGFYGTINVPSNLNVPGSRMYNNFWNEKKNQLWLFGGEGFGASATSVDHLNDLWTLSAKNDNDSISTPMVKICSGSNVTLTVNNPTTNITWHSGITSTVVIATGTVLVTPPLVAVSAPTLYPYSVQKSCLAKPRATITITVHPLPQITITGTNVSCNGAAVTLTASGASTYTWNTNASTAVAMVVPTGTLYTATAIGTGSTGCENSINHTISVLPLPTLSINPEYDFICINFGQVVTLSGASTYTWYNGVTTPSLALTFTSAPVVGPYTITATGKDVNGCVDTLMRVYSLAICESVAENQDQISVKLYPLPSSNEFTIEGKAIEGLLFRIFDLFGREVYSVEISSQKMTLMTGLPAGIYLYHLSGSKKITQGKLLIK